MTRLCLYLFLILSCNTLAWALPEDREKPIQIQSQRMAWDNQQQKATYSGQVEIIQGQLLLQSEQLRLERNADGSLRQASASSPGNQAYMSDLPKADAAKVEAWAETIDYLPEEEKVVLTGNARLVQGNDSFRGHRLTYHLTSQNVEAEQNGSDSSRVEVIFTPRQQDKNND